MEKSVVLAFLCTGSYGLSATALLAKAISNHQKSLRSTINNQQSTINNQQSTINNQQSTINNQQSTINNQQSTINNQQSTINNQQTTNKGGYFISPHFNHPLTTDVLRDTLHAEVESEYKQILKQQHDDITASFTDDMAKLQAQLDAATAEHTTLRVNLVAEEHKVATLTRNLKEDSATQHRLLEHVVMEHRHFTRDALQEQAAAAQSEADAFLSQHEEDRKQIAYLELKLKGSTEAQARSGIEAERIAHNTLVTSLQLRLEELEAEQQSHQECRLRDTAEHLAAIEHRDDQIEYLENIIEFSSNKQILADSQAPPQDLSIAEEDDSFAESTQYAQPLSEPPLDHSSPVSSGAKRNSIKTRKRRSSRSQSKTRNDISFSNLPRRSSEPNSAERDTEGSRGRRSLVQDPPPPPSRKQPRLSISKKRSASMPAQSHDNTDFDSDGEGPKSPKKTVSFTGVSIPTMVLRHREEGEEDAADPLSASATEGGVLAPSSEPENRGDGGGSPALPPSSPPPDDSVEGCGGGGGGGDNAATDSDHEEELAEVLAIQQIFTRRANRVLTQNIVEGDAIFVNVATAEADSPEWRAAVVTLITSPDEISVTLKTQNEENNISVATRGDICVLQPPNQEGSFTDILRSNKSLRKQLQHFAETGLIGNNIDPTQLGYIPQLDGRAGNGSPHIPHGYPPIEENYSEDGIGDENSPDQKRTIQFQGLVEEALAEANLRDMPAYETRKGGRRGGEKSRERYLQARAKELMAANPLWISDENEAGSVPSRSQSRVSSSAYYSARSSRVNSSASNIKLQDLSPYEREQNTWTKHMLMSAIDTAARSRKGGGFTSLLHRNRRKHKRPRGTHRSQRSDDDEGESSGGGVRRSASSLGGYMRCTTPPAPYIRPSTTEPSMHRERERELNSSPPPSTSTHTPRPPSSMSIDDMLPCPPSGSYEAAHYKRTKIESKSIGGGGDVKRPTGGSHTATARHHPVQQVNAPCYPVTYPSVDEDTLCISSLLDGKSGAPLEFVTTAPIGESELSLFAQMMKQRVGRRLYAGEVDKMEREREKPTSLGETNPDLTVRSGSTEMKGAEENPAGAKGPTESKPIKERKKRVYPNSKERGMLSDTGVKASSEEVNTQAKVFVSEYKGRMTTTTLLSPTKPFKVQV